MTTAPAKQDLQTQAAQAADEILRRIATLELPPAATFTERELATQLGMGKVPVREGLLRLSWTGLLSPRTGSGYTVVPITLRSARDVLDAWRVVEPASVELALKRGATERLAAELRSALTETDVDASLQEFQFHYGLGIASGNTQLARAHPGLELTRLLNLTARLGRPVTCAAGVHDRLIEAFETAAPEVVPLVRSTIEDVTHRVLDVLVTAEDLQFINIGGR